MIEDRLLVVMVAALLGVDGLERLLHSFSYGEFDTGWTVKIVTPSKPLSRPCR